MSEPRAEAILRELRETAPPAPARLRERVRTIAAREPRRRSLLRLRPSLVAAVASIVVVGVGAALVNGLRGSDPSASERNAARTVAPTERAETQRRALRATALGEKDEAAVPHAAALPPGVRLQRYEAFMRLRVGGGDELSNKTKRAMADARSLGGYVVSVRYGTPENGQGDAKLVLRVSIAQVQEAIARFSALGTIESQRISLDDIQPRADRLNRQVASLRRRIAELERKATLTPRERAELAQARQRLATRLRSRSAVIREGTYARVSLELTARKPAEQQAAPTRFDRFLDDAGSILAQELIVLLYSLVIAGPFVLLAVAALFTERARRRRANDALLADH